MNWTAILSWEREQSSIVSRLIFHQIFTLLDILVRWVLESFPDFSPCLTRWFFISPPLKPAGDVIVKDSRNVFESVFSSINNSKVFHFTTFLPSPTIAAAASSVRKMIVNERTNFEVSLGCCGVCWKSFSGGLQKTINFFSIHFSSHLNTRGSRENSIITCEVLLEECERAWSNFWNFYELKLVEQHHHLE